MICGATVVERGEKPKAETAMSLHIPAPIDDPYRQIAISIETILTESSGKDPEVTTLVEFYGPLRFSTGIPGQLII